MSGASADRLRLESLPWKPGAPPQYGTERSDAELRGRHVLIADDDDHFVQAAAGYLVGTGCICGRAVDADSAWRALCRQRWDALVVEIAMEGNRGFELVRRVAASELDVSVIVATGQPSQETAIQAIHLPVVAYLIKPVKPRDLLSSAESAVQRAVLLRTMRASRERLSDWASQLAELERIVRQSEQASSAVAGQKHMDLMLSNFAAGILDMKELLNAVRGDSELDLSFRTGGRIEELKQALNEAIDTIEQTKGAFKSKQLGVLRKKLEEIVKKT